MSVYDFSVKDMKGDNVSLKKYEGKVLLIVNTATKCGLTPQYTALQELYEKYKDKGLEILDFPCNQFMGQAPGSNEEINEFCSLNYKTAFPRFAKIDVNGKNADPLYIWLKEQATEDKGDEKTKAFEKTVKLFTLGNKKQDIKWNFGKFLIDRKGNVAARYSPAYTPENLAAEVEGQLNG
jgi:glutathione peroxidase